MSLIQCCCDTTPTHTLAGCPCAVPDTLFVTVGNPPADPPESLIQPATLTYRANPTGYSTGSFGLFSDVLVSSLGSYKFRYWFSCSSGTYALAALIEPDSPALYPSLNAIDQWIAGFPGNTCSPFLMSGSQSLNVSIRNMHIRVQP